MTTYDPDYIDPKTFAEANAGAEVCGRPEWFNAGDTEVSRATVAGWIDAGPFGTWVLIRWAPGLAHDLAKATGTGFKAEAYTAAGVVNWTPPNWAVPGLYYHVRAQDLVLVSTCASS
jgi:hypothetical protein